MARTSNAMPYVLGAVGVGVVAAAAAFAKRGGAQPSQTFPLTPPAEQPALKQYSATTAARALYLYVTEAKGINWGSKASPNPTIKAAQSDMGVKADGIYGPATAAKGTTLIGKKFPQRPVAKPAAARQLAASNIPSNPVVVSSTPANAILAQQGHTLVSKTPRQPGDSQTFPLTPPEQQPALSQSITTAPPERTAKQAAQALYDYATAKFRAGQSAELGSKARPSDVVAAAQRDMRIIKSDGIYGPKTMARGKELIGREFPSAAKTRVTSIPPADAPPPPSVSVTAVTPQEAATYLLKFLTSESADMGSKAKPSTIVAAAQKDMGGLKADGIYGPATAKRGKALIGKVFPTRR